MSFVTGFLVLFSLFVVLLVVRGIRAGPNQLDDLALSRATPIRRIAAGGSSEVWSKLGSKTEANGLHLRFDHNDDPQAEASFMADGGERSVINAMGVRRTVRLTEEFSTHHVHNRGYVFRVSVRGTPPVVGKEVKIQMHVHGDGEPYCGKVENDDSLDAAIGGWIEFESVELLKVHDRS